jgi:poly-beta-1,6-N-acetyl-D-glucosamine synthase
MSQAPVRSMERAAEPSAGSVLEAALPVVDCSAGIMAYNEEANIGSAIEAILAQTLSCGRIAELIVVASGCTDRTVEIVQAIAEREPRVVLIIQEKRQGKASAINLFVGAATSPILLMVSADVLVQESTLDSMLRHFLDPTVGMVGGHPVPVNDETRFLGYTVHLLWRLHDRLARLSPKLGEIVAFRNVVPGIPADSAVDEISIQALVSQLGYRLVYEPEAVVYNHGPTTVRDFLRQRRRIYAGHLHVRRHQAYEASTMSLGRIGRVLVRSGSFASPRTAAWTVGAIGLEAGARALGHYDHIRHRSHHIWETAVTTKKHIEGADTLSQQSVLVFNVVNYHRLRLELGLRTARLVSQAVIHHLKLALGPAATVTPQQNGTVVVVLPGPREEAEETARRLILELEGRSWGRAGAGRPAAQVKVACGIIAFSRSGQTHAESITESPAPAIQPAMVT